MYEESLAATGIGSIAIGTLIVDVWWVAAIGVALVVAGVVAARVAARRRSR